MKSFIENEINSIFNFLAAEVSDDLEVRKEAPARYASCKGIISVYRRNVPAASGAEEGVVDRRSQKALPALRYAFYESVYNPSKIGSVAIYGENISALCASIRRSQVLFGRKVRSVSVEIGARPFLDVKFAV